MGLEFIPATLAHVEPIAARMRADDVVEVSAFGHSPKQALEGGLRAGEAYTALVDGEPEAMFGWVVESAIDGEARPWMLGTDEVYRHGRELVTVAPLWLARMFDSSRTAQNLVSAANTRAIRLLERWGFVVERDIQMVGSVPFRRFWQERG